MNENLSLKAKIYHYAVLFLVFLFLALPLMATFLYSISTSWGVSVLPDDLTLIEGMKQAQGITEQLKAENALEWTGCLNNIRACAREIVEKEIIFA